MAKKQPARKAAEEPDKRPRRQVEIPMEMGRQIDFIVSQLKPVIRSVPQYIEERLRDIVEQEAEELRRQMNLPKADKE